MEPLQLPGNYPGEAKSTPSEILDAALDLWVQSGSSHLVPVRGQSMLPILRQGDFLLVAHKEEQVQLGEILVFQSERGLIAHRLVALTSQGGERTGYIMKGDHNFSLDPLVSPDQVIGRVQAIRRGEREIPVGNPLWRGFGRLVAAEIRIQAGISKQGRQSQPGGLSRIWRGGLRRFVALQCKIFQLLFAR